MPQYLERTYESFDPRVVKDYKDEMKDLHSKVYIKSMLHDLGEILTEFSTFVNQLNGNEKDFSTEERHELERTIAKTFINLSFVAAKNNDQEIFSKPLQHFKDSIKEKSAFEALNYLKNNFNGKQINQILQKIDKDIDVFELDPDAAKYIKLFEEAESKLNTDDVLVKVLDTWEGSNFYNKNADISEQSLNRSLATMTKVTKNLPKLA